MRVPRPPKWPVNQLVSFELRDYRRKLETALAAFPEVSAEHQVCAGRLAEVVSEQEVHAGCTSLPAGWDGA